MYSTNYHPNHLNNHHYLFVKQKMYNDMGLKSMEQH